MEGLIYDIKRFAVHDGPGIRTTVFFKGCPLNCWWCHNPESRKSCIERSTRSSWLDGVKYERIETTGEMISTEKLMDQIIKDKVFMDESGGGVTFSGGEPLFQPEFLKELLLKCRELKVHTAIDTSGYGEHSIFKKIAEVTDIFLYDIKLFNDIKHLRYTGVSNNLIWKNLEFLAKNKIPLIFRVPIIPGINDKEEILSIRNYLRDNFPDYKEIHLLPHHRIAAHKYERFHIEDKMKESKTFTEEDIYPIARSFTEYGFKVKIGG